MSNQLRAVKLRLSALSRLNLLLLILILIDYALVTLSRNQVWYNDLNLWKDCLTKASCKARPWRIYGDSLKKTKNFNQALSCYYRAYELDSQSPLTFNNQGVIFEEMGDLQQAESLYLKALSLLPDYPDALNNLGNIYLKEGRVAEALHYFRRAVELKVNPDYYYNLGCAYQHQEQWASAIHWFKKALNLNEELEYVHNNLGVCYFRKGLNNKAYLEFKRALELKPDFFDAHANLGLLYYRGYNDYQLSLFHLTQALTLVPDHPLAKILEMVIEEIKSQVSLRRKRGG